jgi:hypothetical protein
MARSPGMPLAAEISLDNSPHMASRISLREVLAYKAHPVDEQAIESKESEWLPRRFESR